MQANVYKLKKSCARATPACNVPSYPTTYLSTSGVNGQIRDRLTHTFQLEMANSVPISYGSMRRNVTFKAFNPLTQSLCDGNNNFPRGRGQEANPAMSNSLVIEDKKVARLPGVSSTPSPLTLPDQVQLHLAQLPAVSMPCVRGGEFGVFDCGVG